MFAALRTVASRISPKREVMPQIVQPKRGRLFELRGVLQVLPHPLQFCDLGFSGSRTRIPPSRFTKILHSNYMASTTWSRFCVCKRLRNHRGNGGVDVDQRDAFARNAFVSDGVV